MSVTPASQPPASALPRVLLQAKLLTQQQVESMMRTQASLQAAELRIEQWGKKANESDQA